MSLIKVLGIGSPFGDDQAGWKVIELLKQQIVLPSNSSHYVIIESHDRPGVRLIELMHEVDTLILIDAIKSNKGIGTIHQFKKEDILELSNQFSTHNIGVLQALQLASALNALPRNLLFYGIEIDSVLFDSSISPNVQIAVKQLATQLKNKLESRVET